MNKTLCDQRRIRCRGTWRNLDGTNGLPGPVISFFQDLRGFLCMGLWGCGTVRHDGDTLSSYGVADGLSGDTVWGITQDADGHIWFAATEGGAVLARIQVKKRGYQLPKPYIEPPAT